jgi:mannosyltransferase
MRDEPGRALPQLQVVVPNFNWRYSGVTAVNRTMAPRLAQRGRVVWLGMHRPSGIEPLGLRALLQLRFAGRDAPLVIWHARRNIEMVVGLVLERLGFRLAVVFTSEAQRHHTWITRFLIARMDGVIATSETAASYLARGATIVSHGIDTEIYCPPVDRVLAAIDFPEGLGIGAFGRVRPQKGTDVFVAAMCRLLPKYPRFTAFVIGRVTAEHQAFFAELRRMAEAAGLGDRIQFLGELSPDEVPRWYRRIAIYAFTSRNEGFGLTLLEAMASGNALVAARAGVAEKVVVDGETGVLVPPGDVDALVAALDALMQDPARAAEMGRRGRARALAEFSLDAEAERIVAFYRDTLQARGAEPAKAARRGQASR